MILEQLFFSSSSGDSNVNLRRSIVERILKIYHLTCRNLTVVNDNLSRAQGTIEVWVGGCMPGARFRFH